MKNLKVFLLFLLMAFGQTNTAKGETIKLKDLIPPNLWKVREIGCTIQQYTEPDKTVRWRLYVLAKYHDSEWRRLSSIYTERDSLKAMEKCQKDCLEWMKIVREQFKEVQRK